MIEQGEAIFNDLRDVWERKLGKREFALLERQLTILMGEPQVQTDTLSWLSATSD